MALIGAAGGGGAKIVGDNGVAGAAATVVAIGDACSTGTAPPAEGIVGVESVPVGVENSGG